MERLRHLPLQRAVAANVRGRDFVVGDLHGHRAALEAELARIGFDVRADRLFCVGDLIDRGPRSLDTLALLEAPWFHAVMGNHELMLLNYLGCYRSELHSRKGYAARGGGWVDAAQGRYRRMLMRLVDEVRALPLVLAVDAEVPLRVTHTGLDPRATPGRTVDRLSMSEADLRTNCRRRHALLAQAGLTRLMGYDVPVEIGTGPFDADGGLTYVGHCRTRHLTVHDGHVYLEQGIGLSDAQQPASRGPTVVEHARFSHWLRGVAAARAASAARAEPENAPRPRALADRLVAA